MIDKLPRFSFSHLLFDKDLLYNPTDEWMFPSPWRAGDHLPDARARWYMYYSPHDAPGGICLAFADRLDGPWTEYEHNPIIERAWAPHYEVSHVASPHALWMEDKKRLFLWFHGENDTTRLATSTDGIHFDYDGVVITTGDFGPDVTECSYARVFERPGRAPRFVLMAMGRDVQETRHLFLATSPDGRQWMPRTQPIISPPDLPCAQTCAGWLFTHGGREYIAHHVDSLPDGGTWADGNRELHGDLYVTAVKGDFEAFETLGVLHASRPGSPDNGRVCDPVLLEEDGELRLIYTAGKRLAGRLAVAHPVDA